MKLFVAGLSYKTAPVEIREPLAVSPSQWHCAVCRVKMGGGLAEIVLLSTCNRVEIYGAAEKVPAAEDLFRSLRPAGPDLTPYL